MYFLSIDNKNTRFSLNNEFVNFTFPGTIDGALELSDFMFELEKKGEYIQMSSDLNHPNEFPKFEKYSIDIAAGYYDEAVEGGIIKEK